MHPKEIYQEIAKLIASKPVIPKVFMGSDKKNLNLKTIQQSGGELCIKFGNISVIIETSKALTKTPRLST
ncbi:hypothetical protein O998_03695 [Anaplasma phagocytophilum str. Norway variant1]|uniref:Uncharacterized protein n=1 Tax=Anaplasma phagocytophilum str. Norway variant1 TaxID=1392506 RepID=A0A7H9DZ77_ANAPH|nr:hypothetical protein [Anaplasma phagocytophilum]QLL66872.1 hypothetical protein O998_03695 [Anaplasma phagocytophilum str. Norway variant1]